mgnify:CR=1 FL=1
MQYPSYKRELRRQPCWYCGGPGGTLDHIVPKSKGGRQAPNNSRPACFWCNVAKGNRTTEEFRQWIRGFVAEPQATVLFKAEVSGATSPRQ